MSNLYQIRRNACNEVLMEGYVPDSTQERNPYLVTISNLATLSGIESITVNNEDSSSETYLMIGDPDEVLCNCGACGREPHQHS